MTHSTLQRDPGGPTSKFPPLVRDTVASIFALAIFYTAARSLLDLHCLGIGAVSVVMAWPIASHLVERASFRRQLLAEGVAADGSLYQRYLSSRFVVTLVLGVTAFALGFALLSLGHILSWRYWALLALDALLLPFLAHGVRRSLEGQVKTKVMQRVSQLWPLPALNTMFIATTFLAIGFFTGVPDTREQELANVFWSGFAEFSNRGNCAYAGYFCGFLEGIDRSIWHIRQTAVPLLPAGLMRFAGWTFALLGSGIIGAGFTWLLLGAMMTTSSACKRKARRPLSAALTGVLAAIATVAFLLPDAGKRPVSPTPATSRPTIPDPCSGRIDLAAVEQAQLSADLANTTNAAMISARNVLRSGTGTLFRSAESKVDDYLDWYYSLTGSNTRLAMAAGGKLSGFMHDQLMSVLFPAGLDGPLTALAQRAVNGSTSHFENFGAQSAARLRAKIQAEPCLQRVVEASRMASFESDFQRSGVALAIGATAGWHVGKVAVGQAGARVVAASGAHVAGRAAAAHAGKAAASRAAGALGALGTGAALCAPGGPLAIACGIGAGTATWLGADYLFIKADEALHRKEHKRALLAALGALEIDLANGLISAHEQLVGQLASNAHGFTERLFVPARDGV